MFASLPPLPPECAKFFIVYQRFEYALKQLGIVDNRYGYAKANWRSFAATLPNNFFKNVEKQVQTLILQPPKKELRFGTKVGYDKKPRVPLKSTTELILAIADVRNNLFHGGKIPYDAFDYELITDSLFVLREALRSSDPVRKKFGEWYVD